MVLIGGMIYRSALGLVFNSFWTLELSVHFSTVGQNAFQVLESYHNNAMHGLFA